MDRLLLLVLLSWGQGESCYGILEAISHFPAGKTPRPEYNTYLRIYIGARLRGNPPQTSLEMLRQATHQHMVQL